MSPRSPRRGLFAPEVIQTSKLDCGPAALKCLCEGFGIRISYGRLREACQTGVDGTSIDVIEEVACRLGLEAEQSVVPFDHLLLDEAAMLPAMIVVTNVRVAHFVIVWRRLGPWVQVMDPAHGRRWLSEKALMRDVFRHTMAVPAEGLREWLGTEDFLAPLRARLAALGIGRAAIDELVQNALAEASHDAMAGLDAATRMLASLVASGAMTRGPELLGPLRRLAATHRGDGLVPEQYWSFWSAEPDQDGDAQAMLQGAIALRVRGRRSTPVETDDGAAATITDAELLDLRQPDVSPARLLAGLLARGGIGVLVASVAALVVAGAAVALQALVLRGFIDLGRWLQLGGQRLGAVGGALALLAAIAIVAAAASAGLLRAGRRLELDLRLALLRKIPRIHDQYFASRTISDVAERAQSITIIRSLPALVFRMLGTAFSGLCTVAGLIWLAPWAAWPVIATMAAALGFGWLAHPWLVEYDRRARTHVGGLARYYLEAFLGATSLSAHGAHDRLLAAQEAVVVRWASAQLATHRVAVVVDAVQAAAGFGLAWWLVANIGDAPTQAANVLLVAYWGLRLPAIGQALATMARALPGAMNATERLLEPLQSPEEHAASATESVHAHTSIAPAIAMHGVSVRMGGHTVLEDIDLEIAAGSHVALVGTSGSGKSTLLGLLLGWNRPARGEIRIDGAPLDGETIANLRRQTAWVDPAVQLWNQSLLANVSYRGAGATDVAHEVGRAIGEADLEQVLHRLPQGLQMPLGEGGRLVSGGEGQRARFARALVGPAPRLVLLDEPFRGLDGEQRRRLLARARARWSATTLLCATHDVEETLGFDRVLVIEGGRVVEDGVPRALAADANSRYAALLAAEQRIRTELWGDARWRRIQVAGGNVTEGGRARVGARGHTIHITPLPRSAGGGHGAP